MLALLVCATLCTEDIAVREWIVRQIRDRRLESIGLGDIRYIVQSCIFENLKNYETCPAMDTGGGAVKLFSNRNAHLESYHNLFCNCSSVNGRNGGALLFRCANGTVKMFRSCGHGCDALYGGFVTVIFEYAEVNESTYLFCGHNSNVEGWSTTSLNSGFVIFQNHNASYNSIAKSGGGFGVAGLRGLLARFTTCSSNIASNIMNSRQSKYNEFEPERMEYCNFLNNSMSECFIRSESNPEFYMNNCVFLRNTLGRGGTTLQAVIVSGWEAKWIARMFVTDCYFDTSVTKTGTVSITTVKGQPGVTHRLEHLETQKCKAEYPFPTETFTAAVWDDVRDGPNVIYGLFLQLAEMVTIE